MIYILFLKLLVLGIVALFITYATGKVVLGFYKKTSNTFFNIFLIYVLGFTILFLFYSLIKSHGKTINILLVPILGYIVFYFQKDRNKPFTICFKNILDEFHLSLIPFVTIFLYQSFLYYNFKTGQIRPLFTDINWYATISDSLRLWGTETQYTELCYFFPEMKTGLIQYHYPELWYTSLWSQIFSISTIKAYYLIVIPVLITIYTIGIVSLFYQSIRSRYLSILFSISLLSVSTIIFYHPSYIGILGKTGTKLATEYILLLLSFILLYKQEKIIGFIILISIPIFSVGFLPAIFGGIPLYLFFSFIHKKCSISKDDIIIGICYVFTVLLYGIFYYIFKSKEVCLTIPFSIFDNHIFLPLKKGYSFFTLKVTFANFIYYTFISFRTYTLPILLGIVPFLLVIIRSQFKLKQLWGLILCMFICGIISTRLSSDLNVNCFQFTSNISIILLIMFIFGLSITFKLYYTPYKKTLLLFSGLLLFIFTIYSLIPTYKDSNTYGKAFPDYSFFTKMATLVEKKNSVVLEFVDYEFPISFCMKQSNDDVNFIHEKTDNGIIFTIGNPELFLQRHNNLGELELFNYNQVPLNVWRNKGSGHTLQSFIETYKICYFYFVKGIAIPDFIKNKATTIIESPITHSRFVVTN